ncbi:hypothetical protein D3C83_75370 [compost metagenome]
MKPKIGELSSSGAISSICVPQEPSALGVLTKHTRTPCSGMSNGSVIEIAPIVSRQKAIAASMSGVATPTWLRRPSFMRDF